MGRKNKSKSKSHRSRKDYEQRALNAYELASREEEEQNKGQETTANMGEISDDDEELEGNEGLQTKYGDTVIDARALLKGGNVEGISKDDFEDEELDSDEAYSSEDDSDDEMINNGTINVDDDENLDYDNVDESELMPLSAILDREEKEEVKEKANDIVLDENISSEDEEKKGKYDLLDSEDEEVEDEPQEENPFANLENDAEMNSKPLSNVMTMLESQIPDKKSKPTTLVNDTAHENAFGLSTSGGSLSFADMLAGTDNSKKEAFLLNPEKAAPENELQAVKEGKTSNGSFAVPLPVSIQKHQERRAAYDIQKEEVNKWKDTVEANRRAKVLDFSRKEAATRETTSFAPTGKPLNELESKIDSVMEASNAESKKTEDMFEKLETAKMSKEEMIKHTNEMRLMRELMYRGQRDSRRIKKIKSRAYRRIRKKQRLHDKELGKEAAGIDDDEEDAEYERAKERMSLKHKNTSRWAKRMVKSGMSKDASTREELEEMIKRGSVLTMKQLGRNDEDSDEYDERDLSDIETDIKDETSTNKPLGKGVMEMDFMKAAEEREKQNNLDEIAQLKRAKESDDVEEVTKPDEGSVNVKLNGGRRIYTPSAAVAAESMKSESKRLEKEVADDRSRDLEHRLREKAYKVKERKRKAQAKEKKQENNEESDDSNPWMDAKEDFNEDDENRQSTKVHVVDQNSSKMEKSAAKIAKKANKRKRKHGNDNDEDVTIEDRATLKIVDRRQNQDSDEEYEDDTSGKRVDAHSFHQKNLIKEAFAGDDVIEEEFEQEKKAVADLEDDKVIVKEAMPGWGSWTGGDDADYKGKRGNKRRRRNRNRGKREVITIKGDVSKNKRRDRNRKDVIINERVNKKNEKYLADKVPYPYKTWEQYERSLQTPLGQDWNSKQSYKKMNAERVVTKYGNVIDPMKAPFK